MFKKLRVTFLLYALLLVGVGTWLTQERTTDWDRPLWVVVHPIAADGSPATARYIETLDDQSFSDIAQFYAREGRRYGLPLSQPFEIRRGATLTDKPPEPPIEPNAFSVLLWSLNIRWWSKQIDWAHDDIPATVRIYALYYDPKQTQAVPNSLGLQKALIGVVHGFAERPMHKRNNVVIAHELAHTVGATDKYNPANNQPVFPIGYAEPDREPRYPQRHAELMGGRVPRSTTEAVMPKSLKQVRIGPATALELRWRQ